MRTNPKLAELADKVYVKIPFVEDLPEDDIADLA